MSAVKSTAPDPEGEPMSEAETAVVRIPTPLRAYAGGRSEVGVSGGTVAAALQDLTSRYPQLRRHLYDDRGRLRGFVNVFLNEEDVRDLEGEATPVAPGDTLTILPSIAGGAAAGPGGREGRTRKTLAGRGAAADGSRGQQRFRARGMAHASVASLAVGTRRGACDSG